MLTVLPVLAIASDVAPGAGTAFTAGGATLLTIGGGAAVDGPPVDADAGVDVGAAGDVGVDAWVAAEADGTGEDVDFAVATSADTSIESDEGRVSTNISSGSGAAASGTSGSKIGSASDAASSTSAWSASWASRSRSAANASRCGARVDDDPRGVLTPPALPPLLSLPLALPLALPLVLPLMPAPAFFSSASTFVRVASPLLAVSTRRAVSTSEADGTRDSGADCDGAATDGKADGGTTVCVAAVCVAAVCV